MNDKIRGAILGCGFKFTTKPNHDPVCKVCGETPEQPVEVDIPKYNLRGLICAKHKET